MLFLLNLMVPIMSWAFHLKNFIEEQEMLGYLDGTTIKPAVDPNGTEDKSIAT